MTVVATSFLQDQNFIDVCYIVAFSLFIYGLMGLTGPKTAVRGNLIAAVGMSIAVAATLVGGAAVVAAPPQAATTRAATANRLINCQSFLVRISVSSNIERQRDSQC